MTQQASGSPQPRHVLLAIRAAVPTLRPAERRIADAVLADPAGFAARSIGEIAASAGTSTTTVVRFTKRIGYTRFQDLRLDLTRESLRERLETADLGEVRDFERSDTLEQIVGKVALLETLSIADTAEVLDIASLELAVNAVVAAPRIDLFGVGAGVVVGVDLQRKLTRIGRAALEWPDAHSAWTAAAVLPPGAVAIAISHSGSTTDTVEFLRLARSAGATTIAITNFANSPLAVEADIVLRTAARETEFRSGALGSRIAQLMVVDCLFIGIARADYDRSMAALQATYEAVDTRRVRD